MMSIFTRILESRFIGSRRGFAGVSKAVAISRAMTMPGFGCLGMNRGVVLRWALAAVAIPFRYRKNKDSRESVHAPGATPLQSWREALACFMGAFLAKLVLGPTTHDLVSVKRNRCLVKLDSNCEVEREINKINKYIQMVMISLKFLL
uniref:Uncharacterized protein n=1 Tax=Candidatus Kentrum sp. LFY TaxID=2126342 RepID=A0A450WZ45_9GAMM|nr:MAG: hypothetical protein BECKLFY1418C_GA0070996_11152 [Candidatus Kentron sp. LFY]